MKRGKIERKEDEKKKKDGKKNRELKNGKKLEKKDGWSIEKESDKGR